MRIEARLSKEELVGLVAQLTPFEVKLSNGGELALTEPSEIRLYAGVGLRVVCKAKIHWPMFGVSVPVSLNSLAVILRPEILSRNGHDALVFKVVLEHADVAAVPTFIDNKITDKVNEELDAKHVELAWSYRDTLNHVFHLPAELAPVDAFELDVLRGDVTVTDEAITLAIDLQSNLTRRRMPAADVPTPNPSPPHAGPSHS